MPLRSGIYIIPTRRLSLSEPSGCLPIWRVGINISIPSVRMLGTAPDGCCYQPEAKPRSVLEKKSLPAVPVLSDSSVHV